MIPIQLNGMHIVDSFVKVGRYKLASQEFQAENDLGSDPDL